MTEDALSIATHGLAFYLAHIKPVPEEVVLEWTAKRFSWHPSPYLAGVAILDALPHMTRTLVE